MSEGEREIWWRNRVEKRHFVEGAESQERTEAEPDSSDQLYAHYVRGCNKFEWTPLPASEFWDKYRKRRRYEKFLNSTNSRMRRNARPRWRTAVAKLLERVNKEFSFLVNIDLAIAAGRDDNYEDGGAGIPAWIDPRTPTLVGAGAAAYPPEEPSRYWREA